MKIHNMVNFSLAELEELKKALSEAMDSLSHSRRWSDEVDRYQELYNKVSKIINTHYEVNGVGKRFAYMMYQIEDRKEKDFYDAAGGEVENWRSV